MIYPNARNNIVSFDQSAIKHRKRVDYLESMITKIADNSPLTIEVWHEAIINILTKDIE